LPQPDSVKQNRTPASPRRQTESNSVKRNGPPIPPAPDRGKMPPHRQSEPIERNPAAAQPGLGSSGRSRKSRAPAVPPDLWIFPDLTGSFASPGETWKRIQAEFSFPSLMPFFYEPPESDIQLFSRC
jgi:hypothetical protein